MITQVQKSQEIKFFLENLENISYLKHYLSAAMHVKLPEMVLKDHFLFCLLKAQKKMKKEFLPDVPAKRSGKNIKKRKKGFFFGYKGHF